MEVPKGKDEAKAFIWRGSPLYVKGRTEFATQLATRDMEVIDSTNDVEPRSHSDEIENIVQGARKVEQIG